ncbi:MAG: magnesium/cobalt transporter CorA [Cyanobacteria bacterium K_Offshore_surface_m2_239]|nr:magnesium/cobalt transporter CorA [Cyanobacteria bacterium K_Offshore_surface_m2_239]
MLRLTPGALSSQLLEQRPGRWPDDLVQYEGLAPTLIDAVRFNAGNVCHLPEVQIKELGELQEQSGLWIRIRGLRNRDYIEDVLQALQIPKVLRIPLLDVPQRPQVDCLDTAVLVVIHRLGFPNSSGYLSSDQVGLLLLPRLLISVEENSSNVAFPELTQWLLSGQTPVLESDLDDILHFLVDDILDDIFPILESISHHIDTLEEAVLRRPKPKLLTRTFRYRRNLRTIRSQVWPLRHQIQVLLREHQTLLGKEALGGFQEMAELVQLLYENCEMLRNQCDAITQAYSVGISNRMNQVMKTLTILTSIFAPLTFIAGIYGMNFEFMPELKFRYGYFIVLFIMSIVALLQSLWLWKRGWFQDWTAQR